MEDAKNTILIVDDDAMLCEIYEAVFGEEGFAVTIAHDGAEAWEILQKDSPPNVVFTGIQMPQMDGFTLIEKMRGDERFRNTPIAISSHRGLPEDRERARTLGVGDFLIQGTTPPREVVKHIKILLGVKSGFRIALIPDAHDGRALIAFLNKIQGTSCVPATHEEPTLELEASGQGAGEFIIKLMC